MRGRIANDLISFKLTYDSRASAITAWTTDTIVNAHVQVEFGIYILEGRGPPAPEVENPSLSW